jgi:hypothetical protein
MRKLICKILGHGKWKLTQLLNTSYQIECDRCGMKIDFDNLYERNKQKVLPENIFEVKNA